MQSYSLDILADDVANLANIPYGASIKKGSFFDNDELVRKYFLPGNVKAKFQRLGLLG